MSGVDSVGFAEALVGLHVPHDGCCVRMSFDKAIEGRLGAVVGLYRIRL